MSEEGLMSELRCLLRQALASKFEGSLHVKKARAQAYADGYMRALLDAQLINRNQLIAVVTDERRRYLNETELAA